VRVAFVGGDFGEPRYTLSLLVVGFGQLRYFALKSSQQLCQFPRLSSLSASALWILASILPIVSSIMALPDLLKA